MTADILRIARGALFLEDEILLEFKRHRDVFARGLLIFVTVSLIVGLVNSGIALGRQLTQPPLEVQQKRFEEGLSQALAGIPITSPEAEQALNMSIEYARAAWSIGAKIAQLPTPLPEPAGAIFRALARFLSAPFGRMAGWMFYALIVLLAAKILGGRATVQEMLGCTALYIVPHLINVVTFIQCIGAVLWITSTIWGIIIYIKAVAIANEFDTGRALLAVALPILIVLFLALLALVILLIVSLSQ